MNGIDWPDRKVYDPFDICYWCGEKTTQEFGWHPQINSDRKGSYVSLFKTCSTCYQHEDATLEAEIESRKFVSVGVFKNQFRNYPHIAYGGERCKCGRASIAWRGWCYECHKESKLLDAQLAQSRFVRKYIKQLKRDFKDGEDKNNRRTA